MLTASSVALASGGTPEAALMAAAAAALQPVLARGILWMQDSFHRGAKKSGLSIEDLIKALDDSPEKQELLIKALEVARSASLASKRNAIAGALARAVNADASVTNEIEFLRVVGDLDLAHVRALSVLSQPRTLKQFSPFLGSDLYQTADLSEIDPSLKGLEGRLFAVLQSHGLVELNEVMDISEHPLPGWGITAYGLEVLGRFEDSDEFGSSDPTIHER
jgi:hypothetical protein